MAQLGHQKGAASRLSASRLASSVSRRFASPRTGGIFASQLARSLASAVASRLAKAGGATGAGGGKSVVDHVASAVSKRLSRKVASDELPVKHESIPQEG